MTRLTNIILRNTVRAYDRRWHLPFGSICEILKSDYGSPRLGNYKDPVRELIFILLSAKTSDSQYRSANRALFRKYPSVSAIARAPIARIRDAIRDGGLANKKAKQIRSMSKILIDDFKGHPSSGLRRLPPRDAFDYMVGLPGVGPKSAFCVMMYSLNHDVFPVDVNVYRVAHRIGAVPSNLKHFEAQKLLPRKIPDGVGKVLHVALVVHGRRICRPVNPKCEQCSIREYCRFGMGNSGRH